MRGRLPRPLTIADADAPVLQGVARSRRLAWFQVQHARIVLAVAAGEPIQEVASRMECDRATVWRVCRRYEQGGLKDLLLDDPRVGRPQEISPLQRAQIVELACLEPIAEGLHITHWTSDDLARQAVADGIADAISPSTVQRILRDVDLQPHRTRYWRTARLDARFKERAEKVLWCYGNAGRLAREGVWTVAVDEMPNLQVLERRPIRRAVPGFIERQEFEYTRHGTVNLLLFLIVHTGRMEVAVEATKDADHYIQERRAFRRRHRRLKGVFLIQDGAPSHTAGDTAAYWSGCRGWWRPRFTPAHASWLHQAELLAGAFGYHYLKRESWASREEFIEHVLASGPEYNHRYAHPFEWTWTNQQMRQWFAKHATEFVA
ncbi:MAG: IS630 family transposase [Gemmataceae bacterium]